MSHLISALLFFSELAREDVSVYLVWIAYDDKAYVAHVGACGALHIRRGHGAQAFDGHKRVAPPAADQLILSKLAHLRRVGLLAHVIAGQVLRNDARDLFRPDRLMLQPRNLVEHDAYGLVRVNGCDVDAADVRALTLEKSAWRVGEITLDAHFLEDAVL